MKYLKPKKLNKGDKIAIVSLSSGILGEKFVNHQLKLGIKRLSELELTPVFMNNTLKGIEYLKNNPEARALDLKQAFKDNSIKAIICSIGGDDTYQTIPYLMEDEEFRNLVIKNPKIFIGFSDSTNNHIMLNKLGLVTYYGLNFLSDLCELSTEMLPYTKGSYLKFFNNGKHEIIPSEVWYDNRSSYGIDMVGVSLTEHLDNKGFDIVYGTGKVEGILWGGCLESIYDIYQSERYPDQRFIYEKYHLIPDQAFFNNKILFLETSEEKPEPEIFEIMLNKLIEEGIIERIKALMVGKPYDEVYYYEYRNILEKLSQKYNLPIIYNLNFGHSLPRTSIPYGLLGEIDFDNKKIIVLEDLFES